MKSLRSRLLVGFSLLAVVPLGVAILLLTSRVRGMVEDQAAVRLAAALGDIQSRLTADFGRDMARLDEIGRDPELSRLYLARSPWSDDLKYYLERRRGQTGLDFLDVADANGTVIASSGSPTAHDSTGRNLPPFSPGRVKGPVVERVAGGSGLALVAMGLLRHERRQIGFLLGGQVLDLGYVGRVAKESGIELVLRDAGGALVAGTIRAPAQQAVTLSPKAERVRASGGTYLSRSIDVPFGLAPRPTITGFASTAAADGTIASLQLVAGLLALLGLAIAIVLALFWSRQVSRPVERLAAFSERLARGEWDEPLTMKSVGELQTLVTALERMRGDLKTYRDRLVASERQAAWSQMARKVAHEVKNPLTPIAISVADLKRSYEQKRPDFPAILDQAVRTVEEEVGTLRHLLQEFSDYGRFPAPRLEPCRVADLLADLEALYAREIGEGRLVATRPAEEITLSADRGQIRQALINLVKNGLEAVNGNGRVEVSASRDEDAVEIRVSDSGPGLSADQRANLFAPGFTTKAGGSGLGLTIVERIVSDHGGTIGVASGEGTGTTFRIRLPREAAS